MIRNGAQRILQRLGAHVGNGAGKLDVQVMLVQFPHNTWHNDELCVGTFQQQLYSLIVEQQLILCRNKLWTIDLQSVRAVFSGLTLFSHQQMALATGKPSRVSVLLRSAIVPQSLSRPFTCTIIPVRHCFAILDVCSLLMYIGIIIIHRGNLHSPTIAIAQKFCVPTSVHACERSTSSCCTGGLILKGHDVGLHFKKVSFVL